MKQFQSRLTTSPELRRLLEEAKERDVSEEVLQEQRISFAYGNALNCSKLITKNTLRRASKRIRLR